MVTGFSPTILLKAAPKVLFDKHIFTYEQNSIVGSEPTNKAISQSINKPIN
jgi:hypothetical protein